MLLTLSLAVFSMAGCADKKAGNLNRFKQSYQCQRCNLQGVDLSHFDPLQPGAPSQPLLSLHQANLARANFNRVHLQGCLRGYVDACFDKIDFSKANLTKASFHKAKLYGANFSKARLRSSQLTDASCDLCNFSQADFSYAALIHMRSEADVMHGWGSQFDGANFSHANLSRAFLYGSFTGANFSHAKLRGTLLASTGEASDAINASSSALWAGVNFTDADLTEAVILEGAGMSKDKPADLSKAILCRTIMPNGGINHRDCYLQP